MLQQRTHTRRDIGYRLADGSNCMGFSIYIRAASRSEPQARRPLSREDCSATPSTMALDFGAASGLPTAGGGSASL